MKRPFRVALLAIIFFLVAVVNCLRMGEAIFFWKTLEEYGANPLYISVSGGIWLIAAIFLIWIVWRGTTLGWMATLISTFCYTAWYWFDRLILEKPHANEPFVVAENIIILALILIILFSPKTRRYFQRDAHER